MSKKAQIYLPSDKRFEKLADVWDLPKFKLMVFVIEGKELPSDKRSQLSVAVRIERKPFGKTSAQVGPEPKWGGLFWVGFDSTEMVTVVLDVFDKKVHLGEARLSLPKIAKESLVDSWVPLKAAMDKKSKVPAAPPSVPGLIHIRYLFSAVPEHRPPRANEGIMQEYFYKKNNIQFRAGDMLAFSGTGLLDTSIKLLSNSEHSHVGLVVQLPNKWHGDDELYVLELTYNLDSFIDPFAEAARRGLCLFKLRERLHSYHGGLISHYPLKKPLDGIPITDLGEAVRRVHAKEELPSINNSIVTQFILRNFPHFDAKRNLNEFVSLSGAKFVANALCHIAVLKEETLPNAVEITIEWLKRQPVWDRPNLIRMPSETLKTALATVGRNSSMKKLDAVKGNGNNNNNRISVNASRPAAPTAVPVQQQQMALPPLPPPTLGTYNNQGPLSPNVRKSQVVNPSLPLDPQLAEMEREMKRLEAEAAEQYRVMAEQEKRLEEERKQLEAAMLASEQQVKALEKGTLSRESNYVKGDDNEMSDSADDDNGAAANSQLNTLASAGFNSSHLGGYKY